MKLSLAYIKFWLKAANSKGHGTHSPFVYDFIINILNDKRQFYFFNAYELSLLKQSKTDRKINELLFRMIDHYGCKNIASINADKTTEFYLLNANSKADYSSNKITDKCDFLFIEKIDHEHFSFEQDLPKFIVLKKRGNEKLWQQLIKNKSFSLSVDLFYIGFVVVNDDIKVKSHVSVNW